MKRGKEVGVGCCKVCRAPWPIVRWRNGFECFRLRASSSESGDNEVEGKICILYGYVCMLLSYCLLTTDIIRAYG